MSAMIAIKSEPAAIKSEPPSGDMDTSMSFNGSGGASESQPHVKDGSNQGDSNHAAMAMAMAAADDSNKNGTTAPLQSDAAALKPPQPPRPPVYKIEIPRISSRDLHVQQPHTPHVAELEQCGYLCNASGAKRDLNKLSLKIKSVELEECVKRAKKFAMEQSVRFALVKQQQQQQKQQLDLIRKQQALLLMCRIYVGSIFYEVKEETVRLSFLPFGPIRSISMSWDAATNKHKGFAFIEFETPEAAQLSLDQMNGALLGGRNIKVGRPSNMPQAQPIIDQLTEDAKSYDRIYVSSIHPNLSEQDVQSVFEAFGTIKSCALVRDPQTGKHKGYGFIEYTTGQAALDAIASMNLFDLGGQFLRVGKAVTPPEGVINAPTVILTPTAALPTLTTLTPQIPNAALTAAAALNMSVNSQINSSETEKAKNVTNSHSSVHNQISSSVSSSSVIVPPNIAPASASSSQHQLPGQVVQAAQAVNAALLAASSSTNTALSAAASVQPSSTGQVADSSSRIELTENQKQILGMTSADDPSASLEQQVDITLKNKEQRLLLMQKLMQRKQESKVLILRNMVGPEDVDEDLESEITDECEKYGQVDRVVIYQERQGESEDAEILVKIFVEFTAQRSVEKAVEALNGRFFAGRVVRAEIYDQTAYNARDYSG